MANNVWQIQVQEAGAMSTCLYLISGTDRPLTVEQAAEARLVLDQSLLQLGTDTHLGNEGWLEGVYPWVIHDDLRIWWRSISGLRSETRALVALLNRGNRVPARRPRPQIVVEHSVSLDVVGVP